MILSGPADAGRAVVASDRACSLGPAGFHPSLAALGFRLRPLACALRLPAQGGSLCEPPPHGSPESSHTLHRPTAGLGRRAGRLTRPCGASPSRVVYGSDGKPCISLATPAASRGNEGAMRLQMGGGLQSAYWPAMRPARSVATLPAPCHARRQPIRHKAAPWGRFLFRSPDYSACHASLLRRNSPHRFSASSHPFAKAPRPSGGGPL